MELDWVRSFIEIARSKSISKASDRLNLTQPGVSKQIRRLETYYGVELFRRSAHGMELTEAGSRLLERVQPLLTEFDEIFSEMQNFHGLRRAVVGTLPSLASDYLAHRIFPIRNRGIDIRVVVRNTPGELFQMLHDATLDAVITERVSVHKSLFIADLFSEPYFVVVPLGHPLASRGEVHFDDIKSEPLVLYPSTCIVRQNVMAAFAERDLTPDIVAEVDYGDFILGMVASGAGITIVPQLTAANVGMYHLKALPFGDFDKKRTVSLISTSEHIVRGLQREFRATSTTDSRSKNE